jgi:hypothetical protein
MQGTKETGVDTMEALIWNTPQCNQEAHEPGAQLTGADRGRNLSLK